MERERKKIKEIVDVLQKYFVISIDPKYLKKLKTDGRLK